MDVRKEGQNTQKALSVPYPSFLGLARHLFSASIQSYQHIVVLPLLTLAIYSLPSTSLYVTTLPVRSGLLHRSYSFSSLPLQSNSETPMAAPFPTTDDGYIDTTAIDTKDSLAQRIWTIDEQLSDVESIDDDSDFSEFSTTSSTDTRDIQREWDENMEQGRQLFAMVIFPYVGRWFGKKMSYWSKLALSIFSRGVSQAPLGQLFLIKQLIIIPSSCFTTTY